MKLTIEQRNFIVKSYYETKSYNQVRTKFRTLFPERLPPKKTTIRKNVKKYDRDGSSVNMIKEDQGEELSQEHKKILKRYYKYWKEMKEE